MDHEAALAAFSEFINDQSLNSRQIAFVQKVITHIEQNGYVEDLSILAKPPFDKHTDNDEMAQELAAELRELFPETEVRVEPLSLSVACHIGPGALAIAATKKLEIGSLL